MPDGPANPRGVGFCATETVLRTELEAQCNGNPVKSRVWKVKNPNQSSQRCLFQAIHFIAPSGPPRTAASQSQCISLFVTSKCTCPRCDNARLAEIAIDYQWLGRWFSRAITCCAGGPVAWKLMPYPSPLLYANPSSSHYQRGYFATKHLFATPVNERERYPAGIYPLEPNSQGIR